MRFLDRFVHRKRPEPQPGPQGEEYQALKMARRAAEERDGFAESMIRKTARPFLDYFK
jgi:hypothetical protein